jgi:replicative DNA helicase
MKIEDLIKKLETEIQSTQSGLEQAESLSRLKEIAKVYRGDDEIVDFESIVERIKNEKEEPRIMSGWPGLDGLLRGFRSQQLIVVSAATKSGKTSFLMDLTTKIADAHPLWFPFEESAEELIRKYIERDEVPPHAYTPRQMSGNALNWIETKIVESIAKYDSRVAFIDHLDFVVPFTADSHALRVGQAMRELKGLAKKWNIVIFVVCHLVKTKMNEEPTLEDLRGSSAIAQEADTVLLLWREMKKEDGHVVITDNVNISVQANRRFGKTGNIKMVYVNGKFLEKEWSTELDKASREFEDF